MEFLSERILRLAGLGENEAAQTLTEGKEEVVSTGLPEEPVSSHQPYQTIKTDESLFHEDKDENADINTVNVDYAISESTRALVESRLRDAIRMELKAILAENEAEDDEASTKEGAKYGATGLKRVTRTKRGVFQGGVGVGFKNWRQN